MYDIIISVCDIITVLAYCMIGLLAITVSFDNNKYAQDGRDLLNFYETILGQNENVDFKQYQMANLVNIINLLPLEARFQKTSSVRI